MILLTHRSFLNLKILKNKKLFQKFFDKIRGFAADFWYFKKIFLLEEGRKLFFLCFPADSASIYSVSWNIQKNIKKFWKKLKKGIDFSEKMWYTTWALETRAQKQRSLKIEQQQNWDELKISLINFEHKVLK